MGTFDEPARPRLVVCLGDNAFASTPSRAGAARVGEVARRLAPLIDRWDLVVTHGNGPQIGALGAQALAAGAPVPRLEVLGAEADGVLGYQLEAALVDAAPQADVATLITQMVVDADDDAFRHPDRPVGPTLDEDDARRLAVQRGWFVRSSDDGWHRVLPAPEPRRLREQRALEVLVAAGVTVVCAGGGGIPVVVGDDGVRGVNALIDKDLAASVVADAVGAAGLVLLTDVDGVYEGFGTGHARRVRALGLGAARAAAWPPLTIGPKLEAAARFVAHRSRWAAIGSLDEAVAVVDGDAGTRVVDGDDPITYWE
jgi:carbamate kinase